MTRRVFVISPKTRRAAYEAVLLGAIEMKRWSRAPIWASLAVSVGDAGPIRSALSLGWGFATSPEADPRWFFAGKGGRPLGRLRWSRQVVPDGRGEPEHVRLTIWQPDACDPNRATENPSIRVVAIRSAARMTLRVPSVARAALLWTGSTPPVEPVGTLFPDYADLAALFAIRRTDAVVLPGIIPRALMLAAGVADGDISWGLRDVYSSLSDEHRRGRTHSKEDAIHCWMTDECGMAPPMILDGERVDFEGRAVRVARAVVRRFGRTALLTRDPNHPAVREFVSDQRVRDEGLIPEQS